MADKLMYIPNVNTESCASLDDYLCLKRFETHFNALTNKNSLKSPKLLRQRIRKRYFKNLGTSVINSQMSPPSLYITVEVFHSSR